MKSIRTFFALAAALVAMSFAASLAADFNELLGERTAATAGQTERIRVGRSLGGFWGIIVETGNPAPVFERIVVHYQDGGHEVLDHPDAGDGLTIEFGQKGRLIDRVEFTYGDGPQGAEYRVLGMKTRPHH